MAMAVAGCEKPAALPGRSPSSTSSSAIMATAAAQAASAASGGARTQHRRSLNFLSPPSIGDGFDLHERALGQGADLDGGPRGAGSREPLRVDRVHLRPLR